MLLNGKVCLITGSGGAIGRESALLFAKEGAKVVVHDVREEAGQATLAAIKAEGGDAIFLSGDVTHDVEVRDLYNSAVEHFGRLDVSFHNAGTVYEDDTTPVETPLDVWEKTIDVNLKGVFLCCRYAVPKLLASGGGSIINVASFVAVMGAALAQTAYSASKGGVLSMTREIAAIYARQGVRANALCPGPVRTQLVKYLIADEQKRQNRLNHIPMNRFGEPEDVSKAALFLASDLSSYVTGTTFLVDGGISAAYLTEGP